MKNISIIGCFAFGTDLFDGQTIKTRTISNELSLIYGEDAINNIDSYCWNKKAFKLFISIFKQFHNSVNIIMMPARNGLLIFTPLLTLMNNIYKRKLFYIVIGGWLFEFLKERPGLVNKLSKFNAIYVETNKMKTDLEKLHLHNVYVLPNFKSIKKAEYNFNYNKGDTLKLCTFSRVMKEKGITDAMELTNRLSSSGVKCTLDIYGKVDKEYKDEFSKLTDKYSKYVSYKGIISPNESVEILKNYDVMLFLTKYEGEGFPGTLIDAMFAGLPVIATDWKYNKEIIIEGKTGYLVDIKNIDDSDRYLRSLSLNPSQLASLKSSCLDEADKYTSPDVLRPLLERL